MRVYNKAYSYDDISVWDDDTWCDGENEASIVFKYMIELLQNKAEIDIYDYRSDEVSDSLNHVMYFKDVVEEWKNKGMCFSSYGMMGLVMAPIAIVNKKFMNPKVLFIPYLQNDSKHQAMNLLKEYEDVISAASKENVLVQFIDLRMACSGAMNELIIETAGTFQIDFDKVFLDISFIEKSGGGIEEIKKVAPDFNFCTDVLCGVTVINVSNKLTAHSAHQHDISRIYQNVVKDWDYDRHIRSLAGKKQAESMKLERDFYSPHDSGMQLFFKEKGIRYSDYTMGNQWYITLTPENAFEMEKGELPLLIVLKEPRKACEFAMQTAFQFYYDFIDICGQGEFMMLFFALETPEDNEVMLPNIIEKVLKDYPMIDSSQIYLTGQSHNGYYAQEFYRKHPKLIAACAALCDPVGLEYGARADYYLSRADELIGEFKKYNYPLIVINGNLENNYNKVDRNEIEREHDIQCFINRMTAWRLKRFSKKRINDARISKNYATKMNGVPADRCEVRYSMGTEIYISDYKNEEGRWNFRYVSIENTPHMIMPQMAELSWEFLRRFKRDNTTGESIELY